jgi:hypothetical protein
MEFDRVSDSDVVERSLSLVPAGTVRLLEGKFSRRGGRDTLNCFDAVASPDGHLNLLRAATRSWSGHAFEVRAMSGTQPNERNAASDAVRGRPAPPPKSLIPTRFSLLAPSQSFQEHEVELGPSYQLQSQDVVCGTARETASHPGNGRYRVLIEMRLERYRGAGRAERSRIVREVVSAVRESGGNFVRLHRGVWYDVGNSRAREKTGSAIRGLVKNGGTGRIGRRASSRISSTNVLVSDAAAAASGSLEAGLSYGSYTGRIEEGFAFSSSTENLGVVDADSGRLSPEPIGALPSRIRKPDGFDEFVRNTFLHESNELQHDEPPMQVSSLGGGGGGANDSFDP